MKNYTLALVSLLCLYTINGIYGQTNFSSDPLNAKFVTSDVTRFYEAFDQLETSTENPFEDYIKKGSPGVKGFIRYRIINADSLYNMVLRRKAGYEKNRNILDGLDRKTKRIRAIYTAMKYWYPDAVFPPIYFVVGRFNSGGTVSEDGLLIGSEMLSDLEGLPGLAAHELIHFQQKLNEREDLLTAAIAEGSADFIGELISGDMINSAAYQYGEQYEEKLCKEFVLSMYNNDNTDWLYGTSGKDDRPNDLGYWMGYKITEAYFYSQTDKHAAIDSILNFQDVDSFLEASGYLKSYIQEVSELTEKEKEEILSGHSEETFEVTFRLNVPNAKDEVYITGSQIQLGKWQPNKIKMERIATHVRQITIKVHSPAAFKFTRGSWDSEAHIKGIEGIPNLSVRTDKPTTLEYTVERWSDEPEQ